MRKQNIVSEKPFEFALKVIKIYKHLVYEEKEYVLSKQLLRSGTSIGANVNEALEAQLRADFIHKMSISLKDARETPYWLRLLKEANYICDIQEAESFNEELIRILVSIVKTTKGNKR